MSDPVATARPTGAVPAAIGVVGAGTMGSGIAQLASLAGARTLLYDPDESALERGLELARANLAKGAERGRWTPDEAAAAETRLEPAPSLDQLAPCGLVIEAAPESLELKRELFARLARIVDARAVLATNTSSLSVTAVAAGTEHPERVVGMHFFNPAPLMRLVEIVAGSESSEQALAVARATGEAMGKRAIDAADVVGFLVNRCNRPFGLEAMRLLQERRATLEAIDRICRLGAGFRMGPFELMDLVGTDVGFEISRSFHEQSFGEPRWQPSPLAARLVAAGRHGRKVGRGWYDYRDGPHRPDDPEPPAAGGGDGLVVLAGDGVVAHALYDEAADAGWDARWPEEAIGEVPALIVDCTLGEGFEATAGDEDDVPLQGGPRLVLCAAGSLATLDPEGTAAGFHLLPSESGSLVELTEIATTAPTTVAAAERFFATLGQRVERVGDAPGLVLGRIVCQLVNEAAFALGEGVGSADDIDAGMVLGLNHPRGPLAWGDEIGLEHVLAVLDALADEYREPRYRAAPLLRQLVLEGRLGVQTGAGFHEYDQ